MHSIIYTTPTDVSAENKLEDAINSLHFILNFHLEQIRIKANEYYKLTGPTVKNKYFHKEPDGVDKYTNEHYDLY